MSSIEQRFIGLLQYRSRSGYYDDDWGEGGCDGEESPLKDLVDAIFVVRGEEVTITYYIVITADKRIGRTWHDQTGYSCQGDHELTGCYKSFEDLFDFGLTNPERKEVLDKFHADGWPSQ